MSRSPINGVTWILYRLIAALANLVLKQISSRPRYVLHLTILALSGVTALAVGAGGASHWFGQHEVSRGTPGYSKGSGTSQGKGKDIEPSLTSLELPPVRPADQVGDANIEIPERMATQSNDTGIEMAQSSPSLEPEERTQPILSSRGGQRPQDDAARTTAKKEPLKSITYQVAAGDTLLGIAEKFGISSETLLWANDMKDGGELLQIGQSLTVIPVSGVLHKVKEGDTLLGIAFEHEASPEDIIEANALEEPYLLGLEQLIVVPGGRQVPPPAPVPPLPVVEHRVEAGETVSAIALMHGVEPIVVVRANNLSNPDALALGQRLSVPGGKPAEARPAPAVASTGETPRPAPPARGPQPSPPPAPAQVAKPAEPKPAAASPPAGQSAQAAPSANAAQPAPQQAQPPKASGKGDEIVAAASAFAGGKYLWGGHSPATGFDCSGFTWYIYKQGGINIPQHDLWGQVRAGRPVKRDELLPGDLVFFQNTYQPGLSHSGIYVGNGRFISAASENSGIRFDRLDDPYWGPRYFGASRPW